MDLKKGEIINITQKRVYKIVPLPEFMEKLLNLGGLLPYIKKGI
jgi:3-isopropylmalate dehydratase small subunit